MKVEAAVLGSPSLTVLMVSACGRKATLNLNRKAQELCESRGGRPGLPPVPDSSYGLCGRKASLNLLSIRVQELCQSRSGRPGLPVPNSPCGLC